MIAVLSGGVGAARFLEGLVRVVQPGDIAAVVNTGDDMVLHGLHISPDLDTVTYTLAGEINPHTGWGLRGETWQAMTLLEQHGGEAWFRLGDRDLATHLHRTQRLSEGATLSEVTAELAASWGLEVHILPVTDDRLRTMITIPEAGEIGFQEYFVGRQHDAEVLAVRFEGADAARPAPGVLDAIAAADTVVIAPSNPIVSIGPLLAVPGIREALTARRTACVAVSPIIGGQAVKGPAARMLRELGHQATAAGVAELYAEVAATIVIDEADRELASDIEALGLSVAVEATLMSDVAAAEHLARRTLEAV